MGLGRRRPAWVRHRTQEVLRAADRTHAGRSAGRHSPRSSLLSRLRSRLTFSNVVALIALCIALGGTSYAAAKLPRNSVSSPQVRDGSLRAGDFAKGQLPPGAAGANG